MKKCKQLFLFSVLMFVISTATVQAQIKAGAGVIFGSGIEQVGVQGDVHYQFAAIPALELGGGFAYYFPKNNHDFYEVNINGVIAFYEQFMFRSYLYSGLNYSRSKVSAAGVSVSESAFGLNAGIGAEYDFGGVRAFGDLKYVVGKLDQAVFTIGLRVPF